MENIELFEDELESSTESVDTTENGKGIQEIRQDVTEIFNETEHENEIETVSDGDSIVRYDEEFSMIIDEIIAQREQLESLQEYVEYSNQTIFEKPLENYTVTESLLLITLFVVLSGVLIKLIGGIITCKI